MPRRSSIAITIAIGTWTMAIARADEIEPSRAPHLVNSDSTANVAGPTSEAGSLLQIDGDAAAMFVFVRQTSTMDVLSKLQSNYRISFKSAAPLEEVVDGTYAGSLGEVVSHLLDGYNFVIKKEKGYLVVNIYNKGEAQAVVAPSVASFRQHRVPTTTRISKNR